MPEKCILLEDITAYKQISKWIKWSLMLAKPFTERTILQGSLLVELTEVESRESNEFFTPPLNYKKYSDDSVKLYCKPKYVLQLNDQQFDLLLGVKFPYNRFDALSILSWAEQLKVELAVNVAIATIPNPVRGVIRYIGALTGEQGTKFGVELLVSK